MAVPGRARNQELEPINLTPLLDCILNLIFFFLLATTIKENTRVMEVQIPQSGVSTQKPQLPKELVVTIGAEGNLFLNEDAVTSAVLKTRLGELKSGGGETLPVRIRSDKATRAQVLVDVMSICEASGYPNFGLEVKPAGGSR